MQHLYRKQQTTQENMRPSVPCNGIYLSALRKQVDGPLIAFETVGSRWRVMRTLRPVLND